MTPQDPKFPYPLLETLDEAELRCLMEDLRFGEQPEPSDMGLVGA